MKDRFPIDQEEIANMANMGEARTKPVELDWDWSYGNEHMIIHTHV
jgi:hypothetical protein